MKRNNKKFIFTTIIFCVFIVALAGCSKIRVNTYKDNVTKEKNDDANIEADVSDKTNDADSLSSDEDFGDNEVKFDFGDIPEDIPTPTPVTVQPIKNIELMIYSINVDGELETRTALVPEDVEITPEIILNTVVDSMADNSIIVGIEDVTTEGDTIIVSFYSDQAPLSNVGSGIELAILNAIAQSLLDNLDDYNKIIYRQEGSYYSSGHMEFGIDEIFMER